MGVINREKYPPGVVIASHYALASGSSTGYLTNAWATIPNAATINYTPPVDVYYFVTHYMRVDLSTGWAEVRTMVNPYTHLPNYIFLHSLTTGSLYAGGSSVWRVPLESGVSYTFTIQGLASGTNNATYYCGSDGGGSGSLTGWAIPRYNIED